MSKFLTYIHLIILLCTSNILLGQDLQYSGYVKNIKGQGIPFVHMSVEGTKTGTTSNKDGYFELSFYKKGDYNIQISSVGYSTKNIIIHLVESSLSENIVLTESTEILEEVPLTVRLNSEQSILRLKSIEHTAIYASKKNEVIKLQNMVANKSSNNARQVFSKIPGLTVWESDCAGLQLGIGARGLSPDRSSNFNTRQNGYDIAADALGYPESYYTPPIMAIDKIEIVRGAASLQYGTQFGGLVNLKLKEGSKDEKFTVLHLTTYNSLGFTNTYNEVGGQIGKLNYFAFVNYRTGSCNRPNTDFSNGTVHLGLKYKHDQRLSFSFDLTHMNYLAQQAGGLTDVQFQQDPYQSLRTRNWFAVNWNLASFNVDYRWNEKLLLSSKTFGLIGSRKAVGFIQIPTRLDGPDFTNRDLLVDFYQNFGNETKLLYRYTLNKLPSALLIGSRIYHGNTTKKQGFGSKAVDADFNFDSDQNLLSDYLFPSNNLALFAENVFNINKNLSISPGVRFEFINTNADGFYESSIRVPLTGQIVIDSVTQENRSTDRALVLAGIGTSYKLKNSIEVYANISQNYRAITFNNLRVSAPAYDIDPNLKDERGFNTDLGIRGRLGRSINLDLGIFLLHYNDKIGSVVELVEDVAGNVRIIRYTTNIADASIAGLEAYIELDWMSLMEIQNDWRLNTFINLSHIKGEYYNSEEPAINGNKVENVPEWNLKSGLSTSYKNIRCSFQYSYLSSQFSDATNAEQSASGIYGTIPAYWVLDFSSDYQWQWLKVEFGINNLTNNAYFTRRAIGYPGPGIIPSAPRAFYFGLGFTF